MAQRDPVAALRTVLEPISVATADDPTDGAAARHLLTIADTLVRTGVWIIGGDGWAYDIGFNGVDHVLAQRPQRQLVGARHRGVLQHRWPVVEVDAPLRGGKVRRRRQVGIAKKDLGAIGAHYGNVYVAQISMGANDPQATKALLEADAWPGPSLVIAYSTCIAHGIDMSTSMSHQKDAVRSGYWPLYRFHPTDDADGTPFHLDSKPPTVADFVESEVRFAVLERSDPDRARELASLLQADIDERWHYYTQEAGVERSVPQSVPPRRHAGAGSRRRHRLRAGGPHRPSRRHRRRGGGPAMSADLRTRYLGLELLALVGAPRQPAERARGVGPRRRRRGRPPHGACRRCSRRRCCHEQVGLTTPWRPASHHVPGSLDYFPDFAAAHGRPDRYVRSLAPLKAAVDVPGDRLPERGSRRLVGDLRRPSGRRRRRRHRAEPLLGGRRPPSLGGRGRGREAGGHRHRAQPRSTCRSR